jgi:hypothetical protein
MFKLIKRQVLLLGVSTILGLFSLASIVTFTDPERGSWLTFGFFYASLFLVTLGLFTIIGLVYRSFKLNQLHIVNLTQSFRQAFFIAVLAVTTLLLQSQGILFWWVWASLILFFISIEIFVNLKV